MPRSKNNADKEPTKTSIVYQTLVSADDFITAAQLIERLVGKANPNQISAALHHLKKRNAVNCMESDHKLWWYSTPETDNRLHIVDEKAVETEPRRRRGSAQVADKRPKASITKIESKLQRELREANEIADRLRSKNAN